MKTPAPSDDRYRVGTLQYTRAGLFTLFGWVLWGDFCLTLMETVLPSILPIRLKDLGASNLVLSLIVTTVPSVLNMAMNPIVSFRSDRFRSRWGRRIPFLLAATPFLSLMLVLMGFSTEIGRFLHRAVFAGATSWNEAWVIVLVIGILMVGFQFFNMFVNTTYWYLFNDVVPQAFMARFLGLCRMVGGAAGALYNYFVFKHAATHMREIFIGAGILYFAAFMLMCWRVKEGEYPPPPPNVGGKRGFWAAAMTYMEECFGHRIYIYFFLAAIWGAVANACGTFNIFLPLSMGVTLDQCGKLSAVTSMVAMLLSYPAGSLADRFHPVRVGFWIKVAMLANAPVGLIWLIWSFDPSTTFHIMIATSAISVPLYAIYVAAQGPIMMHLFPRDRYGQFASAIAFMQCITAIVTALAAGGFLDVLQRHFATTPLGKDYAYRFMPVWTLVSFLVEIVFIWLVYREWKRLGGRAYQPPLPQVRAKAVATVAAPGLTAELSETTSLERFRQYAPDKPHGYDAEIQEQEARRGKKPEAIP